MRDHLGVRAAALVDGELGHDARDKALAHLAECPRCRDEVETQRLLKSALGGRVSVPALDRVSELMRAVPAERRPGPALIAALGPELHELPTLPAEDRQAAADAPPLPPRPVPHGWRRRRILAAAVLTTGLGVAAVAGLGGGERPSTPSGPSVDPASPLYLDAHLHSSGGLVPGDLPDLAAAGHRR